MIIPIARKVNIKIIRENIPMAASLFKNKIGSRIVNMMIEYSFL